ncbi:hypothetical protein ACIQ7Q_16615 [Streptomyces sp. NPDC096176]|uniref:hypothetical protein n=1 Tax=Streptomyces sp. NPDC096176 TaxID=3366079 RepID=UPI003828FD4A
MAAGASGFATVFATVEESVAAHLTAEQHLGRVADDADTGALALARVGTVHHLLMATWPVAPDPRERIERLVTALTGVRGRSHIADR